MAIYWGAYSGHARAGISWSISPANPSHNDSTVDVTWNWYAGTDGWGFSDSWTYSEDADSWAGSSQGIQGGAYSSKLVVSRTITYNITYGSTRTVTANGHIRGIYNGGTPDVTKDVTLPARPIATPGPVTSLGSSNVGNTSATISWSAPNDNGGAVVDQSIVQVSTNSGFTNLVWNHIVPSGFSDVVTGLTPNTHYYVQVRDHNSAGWGTWTSATACQFTTSGGSPGVPGSPVVVATRTTGIDISWRAADTNGGGAITYNVQCSTTSSFASPTTQTTGTTGATFSGLTPGTTYYFRVSASNSFGTSAWTPFASRPTRSVPVYNDSGDLVTRVNLLASSVADKLVHLGMFTEAGKSSLITIPSGSWFYPICATDLDSRGPNAPQRLSNPDGSTQNFSIQYPGTYLIEFSTRFAGGTDTGGYAMAIYINGVNVVSSTNPKGGQVIAFQTNANEQGAMRKVECTRRLAVADKIGFGIYNGTSTSHTNSVASGSDLTTWCRVTMIGF